MTFLCFVPQGSPAKEHMRHSLYSKYTELKQNQQKNTALSQFLRVLIAGFLTSTNLQRVLNSAIRQ